MARPPSPNPANEWVQIRVNRSQKAELRRRAEEVGCSISRYMLKCSLPAELVDDEPAGDEGPG